MIYRPSLNFIASLLLLLGAGLCIWMMLGLLNSLQAYAIDRQMDKLLAPTPLHHSHMRDISHCFGDDIDLWNCIIVAKED